MRQPVAPPTRALLLTLLCLVLVACSTDVEATATREPDPVATQLAPATSSPEVTATSRPSIAIRTGATVPAKVAEGYCATIDAFAAFDDHLRDTVLAKDDFDLLAMAATDIVEDLHAADAATGNK